MGESGSKGTVSQPQIILQRLDGTTLRLCPVSTTQETHNEITTEQASEPLPEKCEPEEEEEDMLETLEGMKTEEEQGVEQEQITEQEEEETDTKSQEEMELEGVMEVVEQIVQEVAKEDPLGVETDTALDTTGAYILHLGI